SRSRKACAVAARAGWYSSGSTRSMQMRIRSSDMTLLCWLRDPLLDKGIRRLANAEQDERLRQVAAAYWWRSANVAKMLHLYYDNCYWHRPRAGWDSGPRRGSPGSGLALREWACLSGRIDRSQRSRSQRSWPTD